MRERANDEKWIGQKYGRLTVVGFVHREKKWYWDCVCDCGNHVVAQACIIKSGHTQSCGCLQREIVRERSVTHDSSRSRLYRIYNGMKNRCYNENQSNYENYGGNGVTICDEWLSSFQNFMAWSLSNGYEENLSIDRIENSKGYSPENCRWVLRADQNRNTRKNVMITYDGRTQTLTDWTKELGLNFHTVSFRIHQKGMSVLQALGLED